VTVLTERDRSGFTLLEIMMAVTIFGIVAITVYGTFARTLRSKGLAEEGAELTQTGRSAVAHMADEIGSAFYPRPPLYSPTMYATIAPIPIFLCIQGGTESVPLDTIWFTGLSPRPASTSGRDSDQRMISYFFPQALGRGRGSDTSASGDTGSGGARFSSGGPSTTGRTLGSGTKRLDEAEDFFAAFGPRPTPPPGAAPQRLLRREAFMTSSDALDQAVPTVFLENVASLEFLFYDGNDWRPVWNSQDTVNFRPLPRAVAIDLGLYDTAGGVHHFTTAVDVALADTLAGPRSANTPAPGASKAPAPRPSGL
jgi:prepilin-type N-terminal cleavage/methylation domain-containing protein